jgi:hypothetical protein
MREPPFPRHERRRPAKFATGILLPDRSITFFDVLDAAGISVPDGFRAYATCPGEHLHTAAAEPSDCQVLYSRKTGQIWLHCSHVECAFEVEAANYKLAKRLEDKWKDLPCDDFPFEEEDLL